VRQGPRASGSATLGDAGRIDLPRRRSVRRSVGPGVLVLIVLGLSLSSCGASSSVHADRAVPSPGCAVDSHRPSGVTRAAIEVDGRERHFLLAVPPRSASPGPLVIALHGWAQDAAAFATLTGIASAGVARGAVVALPSALANSWQLDPAGADVAFVDALRASLPREVCIDERRIDLLGFSQGAALAIIDACSHPTQVAALATVAVEFQLGCRRPVSLLAFHGQLDRAVPFADGATGTSLGGVAVSGTWENMARWATLDGCDPRPIRRRAGPSTSRALWVRCRPGIGLELYAEHQAGHSWPGAAPSRSIEPTDDDISATALSLSFFATHRSPA
jgi:polyhydroxybutyrate depolymerase